MKILGLSSDGLLGYEAPRSGAFSSAAGLDLLYGGPVRECYAAPLFVVMLPPLLRGLMVRYDGC